MYKVEGRVYTVKDLLKDLKEFPLDAEIRHLEYKEDREDETCLFEIHCRESVELEVDADAWEDKGEIREAKVWIITTE